MKFNRKAIKQFLLMVTLSTLAIACTDTPDDRPVISPTNEESGEVDQEMSDTPQQPITIEGTVWNLVSYNQQPILEESEITAEFTEGRVNGSAGCNLYFADYQLDDAQLNIETIGSTKKACPHLDGLMEQETAYLNLLNQAESAAVVGNVLTIETPDGNLVFEAAMEGVTDE